MTSQSSKPRTALLLALLSLAACKSALTVGENDNASKCGGVICPSFTTCIQNSCVIVDPDAGPLADQGPLQPSDGGDGGGWSPSDGGDGGGWSPHDGGDGGWWSPDDGGDGGVSGPDGAVHDGFGTSDAGFKG